MPDGARVAEPQPEPDPRSLAARRPQLAVVLEGHRERRSGPRAVDGSDSAHAPFALDGQYWCRGSLAARGTDRARRAEPDLQRRRPDPLAGTHRARAARAEN